MIQSVRSYDDERNNENKIKHKIETEEGDVVDYLS